MSVASVAVGDFASRIFERFDDKQILVIGAGEMAEETLRYLQGRRRPRRDGRQSQPERAELAEALAGKPAPGTRCPTLLAAADLVVSTTGASEPVVTPAMFRRVEAAREQRPLFMLDLAVPRDFEPAIGTGWACISIRSTIWTKPASATAKSAISESPAALRIIEQETARFMADLHHRATAPIIKRLRESWQQSKEDELRAAVQQVPELDDGARGNPPGVRPAGNKLLASAAGIAASAAKPAPRRRAARRVQAAVSPQGLTAIA